MTDMLTVWALMWLYVVLGVGLPVVMAAIYRAVGSASKGGT